MDFNNYISYLKEDVDKDIEEYKDGLPEEFKSKFSFLLRSVKDKSKEEAFELVKEKIDNLISSDNNKTQNIHVSQVDNIEVDLFDLTAKFTAKSENWTKGGEERDITFFTTTDFNIPAKVEDTIFTIDSIYSSKEGVLKLAIDKLGEDIKEIIETEIEKLNSKLSKLGYTSKDREVK